MTKQKSIHKVETPKDFPYTLPEGGWIQQVVNSVLVEKGAYFVHPEGSPYIGLSVAEQCELAKMRRPQGKTPWWRLKQLRKATKQDYEKLLLACTESLVNAWYNTDIRLDYINVYARLPFNFRTFWDKELPRPFILGYDDFDIIVSWRVNKIIDWLHSRGYSYYTSSELRKATWAILQEQEKFSLYYDVASNQSIIELYGETIDKVKEKKVSRVMKGRNGKRIVKTSVDNPVEMCDNTVSDENAI